MEADRQKTKMLFEGINLNDENNDVKKKQNSSTLAPPQKPGSQLNPLIDPCILETIFIYLGTNDLKECRLVNKTWYKESTRFLKKKSMIYFDGHYDEEDDIPDNPATHDEFYRDVRNYLRYMTHFQCDSFCLSKGAKHTEQLPQIRSFFQRFGAQIKHLRLDYEFHSHFNVEHLREFMCNNLPNLEHLDIRNMPVSRGQMTKHMKLLMVKNEVKGYGRPDDNPVFWPRSVGPYRSFTSIKRIDIWNYNSFVGELGCTFVEDLLKVSPNVECIQIVDRYYKSILKYTLEGIRDNSSWARNLKELLLDCCGSPTDDELKILSELNIQLKVLRLGTLQELTDPTHLQNILNKQSPTLKELQFGNYVGETSIKITLPVFPKLQKFELTQDVPKAKKYNITFDPVNYQTQFPVLMHLANCRSKIFYQFDDLLSLQRCRFEGKDFFKGMGNLWKSLFPDDGQICKTLRILDIPLPKDSQSPLVKRLAVMFPEVNDEKLNAARPKIQN